MRIALAQFITEEDVEKNVDKTLKAIEEAADKGAEIIGFTEVQFYPFFPQYPNQKVDQYALEIDDPVIKRLQVKCKESRIAAIPNFYLKEGSNYYDASIVIDSKGEILGISKMVHIVRMEKFYEEDYYAPSDSGFKVYEIPGCKIGIVICYDRHFPESLRSCTLQGAEFIVVPVVNTKDEDVELFEWEMRVQAMQNSVFVAMCNRVGQEGQMEFSGQSVIVGPDGSVIKKAGDSEQLLIADLDFKKIEEVRKKNLFLKLRRPEAYSGIVEP